MKTTENMSFKEILVEEFITLIVTSAYIVILSIVIFWLGLDLSLFIIVIVSYIIAKVVRFQKKVEDEFTKS